MAAPREPDRAAAGRWRDRRGHDVTAAATICVFAKPPRPGRVETRLIRIAATMAANAIPVLYRLGVPAAVLARWYRDAR